jgi:hypothetical protein
MAPADLDSPFTAPLSCLGFRVDKHGAYPSSCGHPSRSRDWPLARRVELAAPPGEKGLSPLVRDALGRSHEIDREYG